MKFNGIRFRVKHVLTVLGVAAIGLTTAGPALADSATSSVPVKLNIAAGGLTLTVDSSVATAGVTLGSGNIAYGQAGTTAAGVLPFIVDDARGEASPSGWHVTASVGNFQGANNASIDAVNLTGQASGITTLAGTSGVPQAKNSAALNVSTSVLTAAAGSGAGRYGANLGLSLAVPQYARPGSYSTTLVISVVTGP